MQVRFGGRVYKIRMRNTGYIPPILQIDNSQRRTFVKSRTAIELTAPEAIGCIEMKNYEQWLGVR